MFLLADLSDRLHDIVAELAAGAAVLATCDFELLVLVHADVERSLEQIGFSCSPMWERSITLALSIEQGSAYCALPSRTILGAEPWIASNIA